MTKNDTIAASLDLIHDFIKKFKELHEEEKIEPVPNYDVEFNRHLEDLNRLHEMVDKAKPKYTESDLISFGNYLLSDKRKEYFHGGSYTEIMESLGHIHDNDITNWQDKNKVI